MTANSEHPTDDRDDVGLLVRLAGPKQPVAPERVLRVKAAARAEWEREVGRRSRRRRVWIGAGLAAAASLILALGLGTLDFGTATSPGDAREPLVEALAGPVSIRGTDDPEATARAAQVGERLAVGSELATGDAGRVAVRLASGHSIRLDEATRVRLHDDGSVALDQGAVYVDSETGPETGDPVAIHTPLGVVHETGTQFEVRLSADRIRVRVREGSVVLDGGGRHHVVEHATELELPDGGDATFRSIPTHGPDWQWMAAITPMPDLDGMSARAFLEWVAREQGWRLTFASEDVARSADRTVLRGTMSGASLEQTLQAVLLTCRMVHRVDGGVLVIEAEAGS